MGIYEFLKSLVDNGAKDATVAALATETTLVALNNKKVAATDATVADHALVATTGEASVMVTTKGHEAVSLVLAGLAAGITAEVYMLDGVDARVGGAVQTITANGLTTLTLAWPKIEVLLKNTTAAGVTVTLGYAAR